MRFETVPYKPRAVRASAVGIGGGNDLAHEPADVAVIGEPVELRGEHRSRSRPGRRGRRARPRSRARWRSRGGPRSRRGSSPPPAPRGPGRSRSACPRSRPAPRAPCCRRSAPVGYSMLGIALVVIEREPVGERHGERGEADRVLDPRLLVEDAQSRRSRGSGAGARPTTGRCSPGSRRRASSARRGGSRSPRSRSAAGSPTRGKARKTGVARGHHPGASAPARTGSCRTARAAAAGSARIPSAT